jgi:hypothetical protein
MVTDSEPEIISRVWMQTSSPNLSRVERETAVGVHILHRVEREVARETVTGV